MILLAHEEVLPQAGTIWILLCVLLLLMMALPGLALFYGGQVRRKNVLSVMLSCLSLTALLSVIWATCGYRLAYGESLGGFVGMFEPIAARAPGGLTDMLFQMMFFCIAPIILCGAFPERMRFGPLLCFCALWAILTYCPVAHWVWSRDGWLGEGGLGVVDAAGGLVVHFSAGVSGLVAAMLLGPRLAYRQEPMPPHNLPLMVTGACLLWIGWFGFNCGGAWRGPDPAASVATAFANTHFAAAGGILAWLALEWCIRRKPTILGACSGLLAGLVSITPAAGLVGLPAAILMGAIGSAAAFGACTWLKNRWGYDDTLDVFGIHGIAGATGTLAAGAMAGGGILQFGMQCAGLLTVGLWAGLITLLILRVLDHRMTVRVTQDDELQGLDLTQHGEDAYNLR